MLILIAESKSMAPCSDVVAPDAPRPQFEALAQCIIDPLRNLSAAELSAKLKLGVKNSQRLVSEIYEFDNKNIGARAIDAFDGVVFRALNYGALDTDARQFIDRDVRIVSSLYGLLRPTDTIKSYRFDLAMKAAPDGGTLKAFWRGYLTDALLGHMSESGQTEVLNLMPKDMASCFDWKRISQSASVYTANFREHGADGIRTTPHSDYLKRLRGTLLRIAAQGGVQTSEMLRSVNTDAMMADAAESTQTNITFLV